MAKVEIKNLKKSYGAFEVLHGIDIEIPHQSFVALVGPSGCGKSTLLRMIAGLEEVTSGDICIDEAVINEMAPKDRDIAMVFQNYALYPHMTVEENMGFALKMAKYEKSDIKTRVAEAAETLNLTEYLHRFPKELSGGQRQRVAMGRCIVRKPEVFLFDEPLSNLDAKLRVRMRTEIRALHQRLGATSIYVTHDQIEAMTMADQIVVMRGGHIEQIGSPLELYDTPKNTFVATFIGSPSINLIEGKVKGSGKSQTFVTDDGIELPVGEKLSVQADQSVQFGIRPEHLEIVAKGKGVPFAVDVVEPTGSETIITGRLGTQEVQLTVRNRQSIKAGDVIEVMPDLNTILLFDAKTEQRIV